MPPLDFFNEAVSNYITFAAGVVVGAVAWAIQSWWSRKRPSIVRVERQKIVSLLDIAPLARQKLNVVFRGNQVEELHLTVFTIYNDGENVIRDVSIIMDSDEQDTSLDFEALLEDPILDARRSGTSLTSSPDDPNRFRVIVRIPYINPKRHHEDLLRLQVYSSKPFGVFRMSGGGPGWSVRYFDRVALVRSITDFAAAISESTFGSALSSLILRPWSRRQ